MDWCHWSRKLRHLLYPEFDFFNLANEIQPNNLKTSLLSSYQAKANSIGSPTLTLEGKNWVKMN
jgi:hypothetical protein